MNETLSPAPKVVDFTAILACFSEAACFSVTTRSWI